MRSPKFIHIPFVSIPSLITPTTLLFMTIFFSSVCSREFSFSSVLAVTDFVISERLISRISVTKLACSRLRITVCLLATRELEHEPHDPCPPTKLPFHSLPPERSIDGLDFHQLIYKRLLAYQITQINTNYIQTYTYNIICSNNLYNS